MPRKAQRERRRRFVRVQKNPTPVRHEDHKAKQKYTVLSCNREKLVLRNTKKTKRLNSRIYDLKQYTSLKFFFCICGQTKHPETTWCLQSRSQRGTCLRVMIRVLITRKEITKNAPGHCSHRGALRTCYGVFSFPGRYRPPR